jgi:hypothetical protein
MADTSRTNLAALGVLLSRCRLAKPYHRAEGSSPRHVKAGGQRVGGIPWLLEGAATKDVILSATWADVAVELERRLAHQCTRGDGAALQRGGADFGARRPRQEAMARVEQAGCMWGWPLAMNCRVPCAVVHRPTSVQARARAPQPALRAGAAAPQVARGIPTRAANERVALPHSTLHLADHPRLPIGGNNGVRTTRRRTRRGLGFRVSVAC